MIKIDVEIVRIKIMGWTLECLWVRMGAISIQIQLRKNHRFNATTIAIIPLNITHSAHSTLIPYSTLS